MIDLPAILTEGAIAQTNAQRGLAFRARWHAFALRAGVLAAIAPRLNGLSGATRAAIVRHAENRIREGYSQAGAAISALRFAERYIAQTPCKQ